MTKYTRYGVRRHSKFRIGSYVKVKGINVRGKVTYIKYGDKEEPNKYKVHDRYWNQKSLTRVKKR